MDTIIELEEFAREIPTVIEDCLAQKNINIAEEEKKGIVQLFLGLSGSKPEKFKFHAGERILIQQIVSLVNAMTHEEDFSRFKHAKISVKVDYSHVGTLFANELHSTRKTKVKGRTASTKTSANPNPAASIIDDASVEPLAKFIVSCCELNIRKFLAETMLKSEAEKTFLRECGHDSVNRFDPKAELNVVELKKILEDADQKQKAVPVTIRCYCANIAIWGSFRISTKLEKMIKMGKIDEAKHEEFHSSYYMSNFKRHLNRHQTCLKGKSFYFVVYHSANIMHNYAQSNLSISYHAITYVDILSHK